MLILILVALLLASLLSLFGGGPGWLSALLVLLYIIRLVGDTPLPRDDRDIA